MLLILVKVYSYIHEFFHEVLSINLPGLGYLYRKIKSDNVFFVKGKKLFFNYKISDNYGRLINGRFNEKETHFFLDFVFSKGPGKYHFVDIGGNVGEFVLDYSSNENVEHVTVFEPQLEQQKAILKTIELNEFNHTNLIKKPVSDKVQEILFNFNTTNSTASGITADLNVGTKVLATTIDNEFSTIKTSDLMVFLIDTEGAELDILKGGNVLISKISPLIIFEFNHVTKKHFKISDVQEYLGPNYNIYRLRKDGKLDLNFNKTWNLVAVPNTINFNHVHSLIL